MTTGAHALTAAGEMRRWNGPTWIPEGAALCGRRISGSRFHHDIRFTFEGT